MPLDLNTPIGYRFTTDPDVMGYNGRLAQDAAMAVFQKSPPCAVGPWPSMLELQDRVWVEQGWYHGVYGLGVSMRHECCIEVDGIWRALTLVEFDHLTVLNRRKRLSKSKK